MLGPAALLLALSRLIIAAPPTIPDAGRVIDVDAAGQRSVAANVDLTPDMIFNIASMTKPVTSLAVMMLVDQGRIGLDDPVTTHLPDFKQPPVLTTRRR